MISNDEADRFANFLSKKWVPEVKEQLRKNYLHEKEKTDLISEIKNLRHDFREAVKLKGNPEKKPWVIGTVAMGILNYRDRKSFDDFIANNLDEIRTTRRFGPRVRYNRADLEKLME